MFGLERRHSVGGCTLAIEIGSASVGMAIISNPHTEHPEIHWQLRKFIQIGDGTDIDEREKRVVNTLVSMTLALGSTGLRVLRDQHPDEVVTDIIVAITAPWSYTTLHHIDYAQPKPFAVTESFVDDLAESATEKLMDIILSEPTVKGSSLTAIAITTVGVLINDYLVSDYSDSTKTDKLTLLQTTSVADEILVTSATDSLEKILPQAKVNFSAFMSLWQQQLKQRFPLLKEYALIDVTSEATELGIVRDGILTHTSHILFGSYSIARELATALGITNEEAHSYLQLDHTEMAALPAKSRTVLETVLEQYRVQLCEMLNDTGDELLIPDSVFLLADQELMALFTHTVTTSTQSVTGTNHTIHPVTPKVLDCTTADTTLYVVANQGRELAAVRH